MKTAIFLITFLSCSLLNAQIEFYLDDSLVNNADVQQVTIVIPGQNGNGALKFLNVSSDTVIWHIKQCRLIDNPNIEGTILTCASTYNPFGGLCVTYSSITFPCWEPSMISGAFIESPPSEGLIYYNALQANGPGCEKYRYYVMEDSIAIDSIDVNYCGIASVESIDKFEVDIFPNPAIEELTVSGADIKSVRWYNTMGELVRKDKINSSSETLYIDQLQNGIYLVEIDGPNGVFLRRRIQIIR